MSTSSSAIAVLLYCCLAVTSARQCYHGEGSFSSSGPCQTNVNWCGKQIFPDGSEFRACDDPNTCPTQGERCTNLNDGSTLCCCDSDLCNGANMSAQSIILTVVALVGSLSSLVYLRS
uniref:Uncharacterized protein n=1 Tax=Plectus sambesii TaxID=2011161 RepID=A0A914VXV8_9BILA